MKNLSGIVKIALLSVVAAVAFILALRIAGDSKDAVLGLAGAVVGATIVAINQLITSRTEQIDRFRLAAIDKRLQAHQEAFALWRELLTQLHLPGIGATVLKCQTWWDNNCLYLDDAAGEAFRKAYMAAFHHAGYAANHANADLTEKNFDQIMVAGQTLRAGVALPPVGDLTSEYSGARPNRTKDA